MTPADVVVTTIVCAPAPGLMHWPISLSFVAPFSVNENWRNPS